MTAFPSANLFLCLIGQKGQKNIKTLFYLRVKINKTLVLGPWILCFEKKRLRSHFILLVACFLKPRLKKDRFPFLFFSYPRLTSILNSDK